MRTRGALTVVFLLAALAMAAPAHAATCNYISNLRAVTIHMGGSLEVVSLTRVGNAITDGGTPCGAANVFNTNSIFIIDTTPNHNGDNLVGIDLAGGPFAPGYDNEPGGVREIEIYLSLYYGDDFVRVTGSTGPDNIHLGRSLDQNFKATPEINLNAGAEAAPNTSADVDVTFEQPNPPNAAANQTFQIDGDTGSDVLDASGGAPFDQPWGTDLGMSGGAGSGADRLVGGAGADTLHADAGDDVLDGGNGINVADFGSVPNGVALDLGKAGPQSTGAFGKDQLAHIAALKGTPYDDVLTSKESGAGLVGAGGNDLLTGRGGNDGLDGGPGADTASYRLTPAAPAKGVTIDLGKSVSQNTSGAGFDTLTEVENVWGSPFADELTGDAGANTLVGWEGVDSLSGKQGPDEFAIRDGGADQVTCGPAADHVVADTKGTDSVFSDCESVEFAPFVKPPPGNPGKPPPGGNNPPPPPPPDTLSPLLNSLRLKPASFSLRARKRKGVRIAPGTQISYTLSEAASVTFGVQRLATGRKIAGKCVPRTKLNRSKGKACRRWKGVRGSLVHAGLPALNSLRFKGRIGSKKLARGKYRLTARAADGAGNRSVKRFAKFSVVR